MYVNRGSQNRFNTPKAGYSSATLAHSSSLSARSSTKEPQPRSPSQRTPDLDAAEDKAAGLPKALRVLQPWPRCCQYAVGRAEAPWQQHQPLLLALAAWERLLLPDTLGLYRLRGNVSKRAVFVAHVRAVEVPRCGRLSTSCHPQRGHRAWNLFQQLPLWYRQAAPKREAHARRQRRVKWPSSRTPDSAMKHALGFFICLQDKGMAEDMRTRALVFAVVACYGSCPSPPYR